MGAIQLNTRLDEDLKRAGDAVLAEHGVSGTEAIRSLWQYLARTQSLPDFIVSEQSALRPSLEQLEEGAGIALRIAREQGLHVDNMPSMTYDQLREAAYEEWLLEKEEGLV